MKKRVTLNIDDETYVKFKFFCRNNGLVLNNKIEALMQVEMEDFKMQKNYESAIKMIQDLIQHRQTDNHMLSGGILMPKPELVSSKPIPTIEQLRYRKGL